MFMRAGNAGNESVVHLCRKCMWCRLLCRETVGIKGFLVLLHHIYYRGEKVIVCGRSCGYVVRMWQYV